MSRRSTRIQERDQFDGFGQPTSFDAEDDDADMIDDAGELDPPNTSVKWVQCDRCQKWRQAPPSVDTETLPNSWHCALNTWDIEHASCEAAEESQDNEEVWPGMPPHFMASREREDFFFTLTQACFPDGQFTDSFPILYNQPVDLYRLFALIESNGGRASLTRGLDSWLPLARSLSLPETDHVASKLRFYYSKYILPTVKFKAERGELLIPILGDVDSLTGTDTRPLRRARARWTDSEDAVLKAAVAEYGKGKWTKIVESEKWGPLMARHTSQELRTRYRGYSKNKQGGRNVNAEPMEEEQVQNAAYHRSHPMHAPSSMLLRRPYPIKLFEMSVHRRANRVSNSRSVLAEDWDENDSDSSHFDSDDDDDSSDTNRPPHYQYYQQHRNERMRLSDTVIIPLTALRHHLVHTLKMSVDNVLKLIQSMGEETDTHQRSLLLSKAVYDHWTSVDRSSVWSTICTNSTQSVKMERKRRFEATMAAFEQSKKQSLAIEQSKDIARTIQAQRASMAANQPLAQQPAAALTPAGAAPPLSPAHAGPAVKRTYRMPNCARASVTPAALTVPAVAASIEAGRPIFPAVPVEAAYSPLLFPQNCAPSPASHARPSTPGMRRGHYLTTRRRRLLEEAQIRLRRLIDQGIVTPHPDHTTCIDDTEEFPSALRRILDSLPFGKFMEYVPPGVRASELARQVDPVQWEDTLHRSAKARDSPAPITPNSRAWAVDKQDNQPVSA